MSVNIYKDNRLIPVAGSGGGFSGDITLETINDLLINEDYGLSALKRAILSGGGGGGTTKLIITTKDADLIGKTILCEMKDAEILQSVMSSDLSVSFDLNYIGEYEIKYEGRVLKTVINTIMNSVLYSSITSAKIVTFDSGTDEEIMAMIAAHYNDSLDVRDYWTVGDTRTMSLPNISSSYGNQSAQTVQLSIIDFEKDNLVNAINGHTKAAITLQTKECLGTTGKMNSTNTNSGGWESCNMRTWCNDAYYNALPELLRGSVKEVKKLTSAGSQLSTIKTTNDKVFLLSEIEIFGTNTYSFSGEGIQYEYYKNSSNRIKKVGSSAYYWWERSPHSSSSTNFCVVDSDGTAYYYGAGYSFGLAPALCL